MPIVTTKPHERCGGTGQIDGQTCPACSGTGEIPLVADAHDHTEYNIKYVVLKVDELETKIETIATQVQAIYDDLNP